MRSTGVALLFFFCVLAGCRPAGRSPPPAPAPVSSLTSPPPGTIEIAGEAGEAPAGARWLAATWKTTCVLRKHRVWCFGDPIGTGPGGGHAAGATALPRPVDDIDDAGSLALGRGMSCVIRTGGTVACWGIVDDGTMGEHVVRKRPVYDPRIVKKPEAIGGLFASSVDASTVFACAVRLPARDVVCWGMNESMQLGRAGKGSIVPIAIPRVADAVEVKTTYTGACARVRSGRVFCWGASSTKEGEPHEVTGFGGATSLAVDEERVCALRGAKVSCISSPSRPDVNDDSVEGDVVEIATGNGVRCDRRRAGTVTCSGLGDPREPVPREPRGLAGDLSSVHDAVEIAVGAGHACARERNGIVRCWGANDAGQSGQPARVHVDSPHPVRGLTDAIHVAMARSAGCALRRDGRVACWGEGARGALDGTVGGPDRPVAVDVAGIEPAIAIAGGGDHFCVIGKAGAVQCWGTGGRRRVCDVSDDECAKVGVVRGVVDAVAIEAFRDATCALRRTGDIVCWGSEHDIGEQTPNPPKGAVTPVAGIATGTRISVAYRKACAVRKDGSVVCWGDAINFELGQRPKVKERIAEVDGVTDAAMIGLGQPSHVLSTSGEVRAFDWGSTFAKTATDKPPRIAAPEKVVLSAAVQLVQDFYRACARLGSGEVTCWSTPPQPVSAGVTDAIDLDLAEGGATCAVRKNGEVVCWGENQHGESGADSSSVVRSASLVRAPP